MFIFMNGMWFLFGYLICSNSPCSPPSSEHSSFQLAPFSSSLFDAWFYWLLTSFCHSYLFNKLPKAKEGAHKKALVFSYWWGFIENWISNFKNKIDFEVLNSQKWKGKKIKNNRGLYILFILCSR
jgi:hypothetical protein